MAPPILNHCTTWRWVVHFTPRNGLDGFKRALHCRGSIPKSSSP